DDLDRLTNVFDACFAGRGNPLRRENFDVVSAAKVGESVVGGHQHALAAWHALDLLVNVVVKRFQFFQIGVRVFLIQRFVRRVEFDQGVADSLGGVHPQFDIHPYVRIGQVVNGVAQ